MPICARRLSCGDVGDVLAVDQDAARLEVVEAQQQIDERRLAGAGAADQPDLLARPDQQREVVDDAAAPGRCRRPPCGRSGSSRRRSGSRPRARPAAGCPAGRRPGSARLMVSMPSCTTPMFSKMPATTHRIQPDMPTMRMHQTGHDGDGADA